MYQPGQLIIYGGEGVCRVEALGLPDVPGINRQRTYYTLRPLYREGVVYTPVDSPVFMRPVISRAEAEALIARIPAIQPDPCPDSSIRVLSEHYEGFFRSYTCQDLVRLIRTVYLKGRQAAQSRKKLGQIDSRYMLRAEDMLHGELAVALSIPKDTVGDYIARHIAQA